MCSPFEHVNVTFMNHSTSADTMEAGWLHMHIACIWLSISLSAAAKTLLPMFIHCEPAEDVWILVTVCPAGMRTGVQDTSGLFTHRAHLEQDIPIRGLSTYHSLRLWSSIHT